MAYSVGGVQHDERGRAYILLSDGTRSYLSPVATGEGQRPEDTTGIFRQAPQWNPRKGEWETPIDWGNIATLGTIGALGGAGLSAAGAFGGGAASGTLPSTQIGTGMGALPGAAAPAAAPAAAGAGAGATALGASAIPNWVQVAASLGIPAAVRLMRGGSGSGESALESSGLSDPINALLDLMRRRGERTEPVHEAAVNLALSRAPGGDDSRVRQAAEAARTPRQGQTTNPRVLEAIQRLMERG